MKIKQLFHIVNDRSGFSLWDCELNRWSLRAMKIEQPAGLLQPH